MFVYSRLFENMSGRISRSRQLKAVLSHAQGYSTWSTLMNLLPLTNRPSVWFNPKSFRICDSSFVPNVIPRTSWFSSTSTLRKLTGKSIAVEFHDLKQISTWFVHFLIRSQKPPDSKNNYQSTHNFRYFVVMNHVVPLEKNRWLFAASWFPLIRLLK